MFPSAVWRSSATALISQGMKPDQRKEGSETLLKRRYLRRYNLSNFARVEIALSKPCDGGGSGGGGDSGGA